MTVRDAARVLELDVAATWPEVRAAYRTVARARHPDVSHDRAAWDRVQLAYQTLRAYHDQPVRCGDCRGQRILFNIRTKQRVTCPGCGGAGMIPSPVTGRLR